MTDRPSAATPAPPAQGIWGGRFEREPAELMQAINVSIGFDKRLWAEDLAGSRAHARMLEAQGILKPEDAAAILAGLDQIEQEIKDGSFPFRDQYEDIHMNVEARLAELIGAPAGRLHTARSRNDQVALDFRLWVRGVCERTIAQIEALSRPPPRHPHARLHPPATSPAGDLRPSSDGLCGDVRPGCVPFPRRPRAHE
jgi:argininosuccinate lyase